MNYRVILKNKTTSATRAVTLLDITTQEALDRALAVIRQNNSCCMIQSINPVGDAPANTPNPATLLGQVLRSPEQFASAHMGNYGQTGLDAHGIAVIAKTLAETRAALHKAVFGKPDYSVEELKKVQALATGRIED